MKTTDILSPEDSMDYDICSYELGNLDKRNIINAQKIIENYPDIFSINYYFRGQIRLYSEDEECRINWTMMIVYKDEVYLKMTEKHSEVEYEICVDESYLTQNINNYGSKERFVE